MTDRETLVEKVALAIQLADECEIPDDYSLGLDPNVSDWGAFLADAVIDLIMEENEKLRAALREYECHCPTSVCEWFPCGRTARNALRAYVSPSASVASDP